MQMQFNLLVVNTILVGLDLNFINQLLDKGSRAFQFLHDALLTTNY